MWTLFYLMFKIGLNRFLDRHSSPLTPPKNYKLITKFLGFMRATRSNSYGWMPTSRMNVGVSCSWLSLGLRCLPAAQGKAVSGCDSHHWDFQFFFVVYTVNTVFKFKEEELMINKEAVLYCWGRWVRRSLVAQASFKCSMSHTMTLDSEPSASASQVLRLQECSMRPGWYWVELELGALAPWESTPQSCISSIRLAFLIKSFL